MRRRGEEQEGRRGGGYHVGHAKSFEIKHQTTPTALLSELLHHELHIKTSKTVASRNHETLTERATNY